MRRVALIYNPASGQDSPRRKAVVEDALALLRGEGIEAHALETNAPGGAGALALEAARQGCDTILACGGDGTVHEILQCLVGTDVALGVVPLGTANALAADLGLGFSPLKAVKKMLNAIPTRVPVGQIFFSDAAGATRSRYFTVAAGIGADALIMSRLDARMKRRFGYLLYMVEMLRVWATHTFPLFEAEFVPAGIGKPRTEQVSQLLAVRIRDFGACCIAWLPAPAFAIPACGCWLSRLASACTTFASSLRCCWGVRLSSAQSNCWMWSRWSAVPSAVPLPRSSWKPMENSWEGCR